MLADPSAPSALVDNFAGQWLQLRNVRNVLPNSDEFPDFDDNLRQAFRRETELFFESIMREDRNVLDLLTRRLHVRQRAARAPLRHPGHLRQPLPARAGHRRSAQRAARARAAPRGDVACRAHVAGRCAASGFSTTSSARRCRRRRPTCRRSRRTGEGEKPRTMREQMAEHRANPVCASCHKVMDPIGFALENFDAVGAWRTRRSRRPDRCVGRAGRRHEGRRRRQLRKALLDASRGVRRHDDREADDLRARARPRRARHAGGARDRPRCGGATTTGSRRIVLGIVRSTPFQMRVGVRAAGS